MSSKKYKTKVITDSFEFKEIIRRAYEIVRKELFTDTNKKFHSLEHTLRVVNTCIQLAEELNAYVDVVVLAAMFHDIGRPIESKTGQCHAEIGRERAKQFLEQENLTELSEDVCYAIEVHRFSKNIEPNTLEARILQDADALDALGAMGLYRTLGFSFEKGRELDEAIEHFHEKLFRLSSRMHFPVTKSMAQEQEKILYDFVKGIETYKEKSVFEGVLSKF
jgi:uncharacterized protein